MKLLTVLGSSTHELHRIKFVPPSLRNLHFRPVPLFLVVTQNYSYSSCQFHPLIQINASPCVSRCRASLPVPDQNHFRDFNKVLLFCSSTLQICAKRAFLSELKQVHGHLFKSGLYSVLSLQNQVLHAYFKCMESSDAEKVFEELRVRNVVSWNISIRGICNGLNPFLIFSYFKRMMIEAAAPDFITFNSLIGFCAQLNDIGMGTQLHCFTVKLGLDFHCFVGGSLVDLYAKCGLVQNARLVFSCVIFKDLILWNVMISCYALNCLPLEACSIFSLMRLEGIKGDEFTYSSLISSCVASEYYDCGKQIHSLILKQSFDSDVSVATALINIYAKHENITDALRVFHKMPNRNVVCWNALIVGCGKHGHGNDVMKLLRNMLREEETHPDDLTLSSTISSCGNSSSITETKQAHALTIKSGLEESISVGNSLLAAYSKCGTIACARKCFRSITQPDLISWTSMINAYAFHGLAKEANETFEKMICEIKPDKVSFLGVLSACAHSGLVTKGLHYFKLMTNVYQIEPETEHYACIVDLLGRSGYIHEAFEFLRSLPIEPEGNTLGAFIGSCRVHEQVILAKWAAEKLLTIEPKKSVNYSVMSNIYACYKHWFEVERLRRKMIEEKCSSKVRGCSWIEIGDEVSFFVSCDRSHPEALKVHTTLTMLTSTMKEDYPLG